MSWLSNELLFYGGMVLAAGSLTGALGYFCISQIRLTRLQARLDMEYGTAAKRKKQDYGKGA